MSSNKLVSSCHAKCIDPDHRQRYAEGDLLKGEGVCIDRCTAKFFEVGAPILQEYPVAVEPLHTSDGLLGCDAEGEDTRLMSR